MKMETRASFGWPATSAGVAPCRNGLVVHYDGAPSPRGVATMAHEKCRQYWRNTRAFHMGPQRGWLDLGYSFGVCGHGVVFEGRGWGRAQAAQPGGNTTWTSVTVMLGDGEDPTVAQIDGVRQLREWLRGKGLGAAVKGHRDFVSTSCPGSRAYQLVKDGTFTKAPAPARSVDWMEAIMRNLPILRKGATGEDVQTLRALLLARSHPEIGPVEGGFDEKVEAAVRAVQAWGGVDDDGVVGPATWPILMRAHV